MKTNDFTLPYGCILRQATLDDAWSIRWLVLSARISHKSRDLNPRNPYPGYV